MVPKCGAETLSSVPENKKVVICLMEKMQAWAKVGLQSFVQQRHAG